MGTVHRMEVTEELTAAAGLERPDYGSAFAVPAAGAGEHTPAEWIREVFEGARSPLPRLLWVAWRFGLLARLGPYPAADRVLGCRILHSDRESVVFAMDSPLLHARNVVQLEGSTVRLGTFVRYRTGAARAVWAAAAPVHHRLVPLLMRGAARRFSRPT